MYDLKSGEYYADLVMCIDVTDGMHPFIEEIKTHALDFYNLFIEGMNDVGTAITEFREKVIVFGDYKYDSEPMTESKFFTLPEENEAFASFINSIESKGGGDIEKNAYEAISKAIKSDWVSKPGKKRHVIQVFSDAPALNFCDRVDCPSYPFDMPSSLEELTDWWNGTDQRFKGSYDPKVGRLMAFVPKDTSWTALEAWPRYWP